VGSRVPRFVHATGKYCGREFSFRRPSIELADRVYLSVHGKNGVVAIQDNFAYVRDPILCPISHPQETPVALRT